MQYIAFMLYLALSASGLILLKSGSGDFVISLSNHVFSLSVNFKMLLGALFYVMSFLLFMLIIPKFNLSYIYPMSAGLLFIIILVASVFILGEKITLIQAIGTLLILAGVIALNIK